MTSSFLQWKRGIIWQCCFSLVNNKVKWRKAQEESVRQRKWFPGHYLENSWIFAADRALCCLSVWAKRSLRCCSRHRDFSTEAAVLSSASAGNESCYSRGFQQRCHLRMLVAQPTELPQPNDSDEAQLADRGSSCEVFSLPRTESLLLSFQMQVSQNGWEDRT